MPKRRRRSSVPAPAPAPRARAFARALALACALALAFAPGCRCGTASGTSTDSGGGGGSTDGGGGGSTDGGGGGTSNDAGPVNTSLSCAVFPSDNPWNTDVSAYPLSPLSDTYIDSMGRTTGLHPDFGTVWAGAPNGIPYVVVPGTQPLVPVTFTWWDESDPGPYPIPPNAPIEGGPMGDGDRHVLVIDDDACILYELYNAFPMGGGTSWMADSGARFDLSSNALRPDSWTSADAAGLPIFPGLVRYDEVVGAGAVNHAIRMTASSTQSGYIHPATHAAGSADATLPPMGLRLRMKATYDCSARTPEIQVLCATFKTYGLLLADNGSDWYISGAPDPAWNDCNLSDISAITGDAFEVVDTGPIIPY
ncbi:MAG TPA: hypothetical protein VG389_13015 [Myxococcota bacterium]|nr:hypothetical protein [Myxococcota bacterium]